MTTNIDDFIDGGSPAAKFDEIGDTVEGVITAARLTQQTDITTGEGKTWANGDPIMQLVVTVQPDDGTELTLYAKGGKFEVASGKGSSMLEAIKGALGEAGIKGSQMVGARIKVGHTGLGKKKNAAYSAPKLYSVRITPGVPKAADLDAF